MKKLALTTWLLLAAASGAGADTSLTPHSATYKVKISVLGGLLTTELHESGNRYTAIHEIVPTGMSRIIARGSIRESSTFDEFDDGVRPREYTSQDTLTRDETDASILFDWAAGEARGTVNGEQVVSPMEALAHDRVSIQYELMHDLLNGKHGSAYTMFELDRLRPVEVKDAGRKTIEVPAGTFEVIGVSHQAEGSKRVTTLWCAEELGYLPVVIEQHRKGKLRVRATLLEYTPL